ncbi:MAG: hypothetical protein V1908_02380 [Candidatus Peregrinibacteria bacterium]
MSEGGDFELFNAPAAREADEKSDEQIREEMKRMQQALAQLRKEESQFKANDQSLAAVIVQFLSQAGNTDLFLLISRAVAQDIPSELILAIIALIDERSTEEVFGLLRGGKEELNAALTVREPAHFGALAPEHKKAIDQWTGNIYHVCLRRPKRVLESIVMNFRSAQYDPEMIRELSPVPVQLSAFVLRKYLEKQGIASEFQELRDFTQAVFLQIVQNLERLIHGQKQLEGR